MNVSYPSRIAADLLAQHRALRLFLDAAVEYARAEVTPGSTNVLAIIGQLALELEEHNRFEEQVLEPLLHGADAWGPERFAQMIAHHREEHAAFEAELRRFSSAADREGGLAAIVELAEAMRRHMDLEEREYLNARVLRDDLVAVDASGG